MLEYTLSPFRDRPVPRLRPDHPAVPGAALRSLWQTCGQRLVAALLAALVLGACLAGVRAAPPAAPPAPPASAAAAALSLRVVGGLAGVRQYTLLEEPFWRDTLPSLTQGQVQAEIVPFDRAGLRGQDMLRLMQLGVVPFGTVLIAQAAISDAQVGAPDLAGLSADMPALRRTLAAYRPTLVRLLKQRYGLEVLAVYAYPAQVLFCRQPFKRLSDLAQRRVRVSSPPQADLMEGLGAVGVNLSFAELPAQMRAGQLDCAITGTMSGHTIGLHEAASHISPLAISWGLSVFAANGAAWAALPPSLRTLLARELPRLEERIWDQADRETGEGLACNTGQGPCSSGRAGHLQLVPLDPSDAALLRRLTAQVVVPRWAQRCGTECRQAWEATLAPLTGIALPPAAAAR